MSFRKRANEHAWRFAADTGYLDSSGVRNYFQNIKKINTHVF